MRDDERRPPSAAAEAMAGRPAPMPLIALVDTPFVYAIVRAVRNGTRTARPTPGD